MRENDILKGEQGALGRTLYKSMGFTGEQLGEPITAIANSCTSATSGRFVLRQLCESVEEGITETGGMPMEFPTAAPCDGIAGGHEEVRYILSTRGLIMSPTECMVRAHRFDGLVLPGSCDKTVPGMLMAAARLEMPAIFLNGGPMYPTSYRGRHYDGNIVTGTIGWGQQEGIGEGEFRHTEDIAEPCPGSCIMLGTVNTMSVPSESLGMSLTGSSTIPTILIARMAKGVETGKKIVELVQKGVTTRGVLTEGTFESTVMHLLAMGGSISGILYFRAIYHEAELEELPLSVLDEFSRKIPQVAFIYPASEFDVVNFYEGGGVPAVLKEIEEYLHKDILTIFGLTVGEILSRFPYTSDRNMVKTTEEPFASTGGVTILKGNTASLRYVIKPATVLKRMFKYPGRVQVSTTEEGSYQVILEGRVRSSICVVLMCEGLEGEPGIPEMHETIKYLEEVGLSDTCALVMDGRFSGSNRGLFVGHISPEAYEQGGFALIQDEDVIEIDADTEGIELKVSEEILEECRKRFVLVKKGVERGYLRTYRRVSTSTSKGTIVE